MSDIRKLFTEADNVARRRKKLRRGFKTVLSKEARGRIGWDIYKCTISFQNINSHLMAIADTKVSDRELELFLVGQKIPI